ncbi:Glutamate receptor 2.2 [Striga hermonthica]|uniref:Glutamate receptor n=1 Tax=Striga hermonthica TaxID=68872 RepID=A0A9N7MQD7_STRHE|nr:Glutamate receptor 2.2 [Striga hermonthica]
MSNLAVTFILLFLDNPIAWIDAAVTLLKDAEVDAIIGPQSSEQASFLTGLADRAKVPVISFSATSPSLHPKSSSYFVRTAVDDSSQVEAIAAIVKHFNWAQVVLVHEDSYYGNSIIPYLCAAFSDINARVSHRIISIDPSLPINDVLLWKMKTMRTRIFVAHMSTSLASEFFPRAKRVGIMDEGYAWIVTRGVVDLLHSAGPNNIVQSMHGVLGVKPLIPRSNKLDSISARWKTNFFNESNSEFLRTELISLYGIWAYDTMWALAMAAERVGVREPPCSSSLDFPEAFGGIKTSQTGPKLLEAMSRVVFEGVGGKFHLVDGELPAFSSFQIVNVDGTSGVREVGIWRPGSGLKLKSIIFPGDSTVTPESLKAVTVSGRKLRIGVPVKPGFTELIKVKSDVASNVSIITGCYVEIFDAVMAALPYNVPYEYIPFQKPDGSSAGSYDEIAYQVFLKNFDAAVGDITITYKRLRYVDFSLPFTGGGGGGVFIIVPIKYDHSDGKLFFLKPFTKELWLTTIALFIFTGGAIWILEHRFNKAYRGPPNQHAGMIFYFPFMGLVFAQRERIVNNFARLVVVVWMFVVLILNSTYTASLSARLNVQRRKPAITGVTQLITKGDYVGCHKGSFIVDLLQDMGFDKLKIKTYEHAVDSEKALSKGSKKGGISALFSVMPYTKLFMSNFCDKYTTIGPIYPTEGFSYVFPKGSPLVPDISRAVIKLIESGRIPDIERKWTVNNNKECNEQDVDETVSIGIPLQSFKLLFLISMGTTMTCLLAFVVSYLYKNGDFLKSVLGSDATIRSKLGAVLMHFDQRDLKAFKEEGDDGGESVVGNDAIIVVSEETGNSIDIDSKIVGYIISEETDKYSIDNDDANIDIAEHCPIAQPSPL